MRADAARLLRKRVTEISHGTKVGRDAEKVSFDDLVALIQADYRQQQNRTWDRVNHAIEHLRPMFERLPAIDINYESLSRYVSKRVESGAAPGTVPHEVAALGRMLKLGTMAGLLQLRPPLAVIKLDKVRKGFFTDEQVARVLKHLPEWYASTIEFDWRTGWRDGKQLGDHRDIWVRCCREAGVPGRLVHDLRRSAVRNLERAGVPRSVARKLTGHMTEAVYRRYAIVSETDLAGAVSKLPAFQCASGKA